MDTKTLTFAEIADWLRNRFGPGITPPTDAEVENAIESLVGQGIIETLWDSNGQVAYRLTRDGTAYAQSMIQERGW
jgi:hypothetical protein